MSAGPPAKRLRQTQVMQLSFAAVFVRYQREREESDK